MNARTLIGICVILFIAGISLMATSYKSNCAAKPESAVMENTSSAMPEHCQPSGCTTEDAASCPYMHGGSSAASTAATAKEDKTCPATPDCPPSKCMNEKSGSKATL